MNNRNTFANIGVIISLTISIVAICLAVPRTAQTTFDYQGVIVGSLSILVTALIGWQIYNIININATIKTSSDKVFENIRAEYKKLEIYFEAKNNTSICYGLSAQNRKADALYTYLSTMNLYSQIEYYKDVQDGINNILFNTSVAIMSYKIDNNNDKASFDDLKKQLRSNPPRFTNPQHNEAVQDIIDLMSRKENNLDKVKSDDIVFGIKFGRKLNIEEHLIEFAFPDKKKYNI